MVRVVVKDPNNIVPDAQEWRLQYEYGSLNVRGQMFSVDIPNTRVFDNEWWEDHSLFEDDDGVTNLFNWVDETVVEMVDIEQELIDNLRLVGIKVDEVYSISPGLATVSIGGNDAFVCW